MTPRRRDDRGAMAGGEMWALGVLVFVVGTLIVAWAWAGLRARSDAAAIATEYLRAFTEAPDAATAFRDGEAAAAQVGHDRRVPAARIELTPPVDFGRCHLATVTVRVEAPGVGLGALGRLGPGIAEVTRSELTDPYRALAQVEDRDAPTLCD